MTRAFPIAAVVGSLALASPASANVITDSDRTVVGDPGQAALDFVRHHRRRLGVADVGRLGALVVSRTVRAGRRGAAIHVGQRVAGLPVLGSDVSVVLLGQRIVAATGRLVSLPLAAPDKGPALDHDQIVAALRSGGATPVVRRAHKAWLATGATLRPVYVVDAMTSAPFGVWRALVDARDGSLIRATSALRRAEGKAYLPNPVVGAVQSKPLLGLTSTEQLTGEHADVQRCAVVDGQELSCDRLAVPDEEGNYLFEPEEPSTEDPFAEVHAYYHVDAYHRWIGEAFGFARAGGHAIGVLVNFHHQLKGGQTYGMPNAFFGDITGDGRGEIVFGQSQRDFAYDADVIYHELTHSVVAETSNLRADFDERGLNMTPGSLNEGFADLLSSMLTGDGRVGEYAGGLYGGTSIRDLDGPAMRCDDQIGESHSDGMIWGRTLWAARQTLDDTTGFDRVLYTTLASLAEQASFADAAALLLKVAQADDDPRVAKVLGPAMVDADLADCSRIVPLDDTTVRTGVVLGTRDLYGAEEVPGALQYEIRVPENASEMRLMVQRLGSAAPTIKAYLRADKPLTLGYRLKPVDAAHSFLSDGSFFTLRADAEDEALQLVPGGTYYLLPSNVGQETGQYQLLVAYTLVEKRGEPDDYQWPGENRVRLDPPPTGDDAPGLLADQEPAPAADPLADASIGGNGGCSLAPDAADAAPWSLLALLALALLRRRR